MPRIVSSVTRRPLWEVAAVVLLILLYELVIPPNHALVAFAVNLVLWGWLFSRVVLRDEVWVLTRGIVTILRNGFVQKRIPLAAVEAYHAGGKVALKWQHGKKEKGVEIDAPEEFADALKAEVALAKAAAPGTVPHTEKEAKEFGAAGLIRGPGPLAALWLVIGLGLLAAAAYFGQLLLGVWLLAWVRFLTHRVAVVHGGSLWVMHPYYEPREFPLGESTYVSAGLLGATVSTGDPDWPVIRVRRWLAGDVVGALERQASGNGTLA